MTPLRNVPVPLRRSLSFTCVLGSLTLHALVVFTFAFRWDKAALVTIVPFWGWCLLGISIGLFGLLWYRSVAIWALMGLWIITLFSGSDERRGLLRPAFGQTLPATADENTPLQRSPDQIRVITLNCLNGTLAAVKDAIRYEPDILLLQEPPPPSQLAPLARELFGDDAILAYAYGGALLARGREFQAFRFQYPGNVRSQRGISGRLTLLDGRQIDIVNLHLLSAERCWAFWRRSCWQAHANNRRKRRAGLTLALNSLTTATRELPAVPSLIAGDFNAPAGDASLNPLKNNHFDAYLKVGRGLGNTFPSRFPLHRIDQIWLSRELEPLRLSTLATPHSNHRFVVCDFLLPAAPIFSKTNDTP